MIIETFIDILFSLIDIIIGLMPVNELTTSFSGGFITILDKLSFGVWVIGMPMWTLIISTISYWTLINMTWAIVEWLYKKLPGVD